MKIGQLQTKHPKHRGEVWEDYRALYEGGHRFKDRASRFLRPMPKEPSERHSQRIEESVYRPYLGTIIDFFAAQQFTTPLIAAPALPDKPKAPPRAAKPVPAKPAQPGEAKELPAPSATPAVPAIPDPPPWYADLENDCDGHGTGLRHFLRGRFVDALITRWAFWRLDFPETYGTANNKFEAEERGDNDVRLCAVKRECVHDWETDESGRLLWLTIHEESHPRPTPDSDRKITRHTWWVYDREKVDVYQVDVEKPPGAFSIGDGLNHDLTVKPLRSFKHDLGDVPVILLDVTDGLWVANRIALSQLEHYRLSSAMHWSMRQLCFSQPVFAVTDPENFAPQLMGGAVVIGGEDNAAWLAPPTQHLAAMGDAVKALKDEIFRVTQQMALGVDNNAAAVGRTAESKSADAEQMHVVLRAYGELLRDAIKHTLHLLSKARGEETDWTVEGLDKFETLDATSLVELYAKAQGFNIPSDKFHSEAQKGVARALLPGRDTATLELIDSEIEAGVPAARAEMKAQQDEDRKVALEATKAGVAAKAAGPGAAKKPPFAKA